MVWGDFNQVIFSDKSLSPSKDLLRDRGLRVIAKLFLPLLLFSLTVPAVAGWLLIGGWYGSFAGLFWGGTVRIFLLHHVTFSINSICHFWGRRRFASRDESRNVWWLSWLSFGESWHNNHHAFRTSAFHGLRRTEIDPGGWLIWLLERAGLACPPRKTLRTRRAGTVLPFAFATATTCRASLSDIRSRSTQQTTNSISATAPGVPPIPAVATIARQSTAVNGIAAFHVSLSSRPA